MGPREWLRPPHHWLALFGVVTLVPAAILVWLGWRLIDQDRRLEIPRAEERLNHNLIDGKRRKRIARGAGRSVQEVNEVLKQYGDMRRMMKQYGNLAKAGRLKGLAQKFRTMNNN